MAGRPPTAATSGSGRLGGGTSGSSLDSEAATGGGGLAKLWLTSTRRASGKLSSYQGTHYRVSK